MQQNASNELSYYINRKDNGKNKLRFRYNFQSFWAMAFANCTFAD